MQIKNMKTGKVQKYTKMTDMGYGFLFHMPFGAAPVLISKLTGIEIRNGRIPTPRFELVK